MRPLHIVPVKSGFIVQEVGKQLLVKTKIYLYTFFFCGVLIVYESLHCGLTGGSVPCQRYSVFRAVAQVL